jgi:hypothetical protein
MVNNLLLLEHQPITPEVVGEVPEILALILITLEALVEVVMEESTLLVHLLLQTPEVEEAVVVIIKIMEEQEVQE